MQCKRTSTKRFTHSTQKEIDLFYAGRLGTPGGAKSFPRGAEIF